MASSGDSSNCEDMWQKVAGIEGSVAGTLSKSRLRGKAFGSDRPAAIGEEDLIAIGLAFFIVTR